MEAGSSVDPGRSGEEATAPGQVAAEPDSGAPAGPRSEAPVPQVEDRSIFRFLRRNRPSHSGPVPGVANPGDSLGTGTVRGPGRAGSPRGGAASAADSLRPQDSAHDSLGWAEAPFPDAFPDSLTTFRRVRPGPTFRFGPSWGDRAVDRTARELLPWSSPLRTVDGGNPFTPDLLDWGDLPGREAVAFLLEGVPMNPPGMPEAIADPFAPSWIESIEIRRPSPLRLPNNPTGGALVEVHWLVPDSSLALSGARLSDGATGSNTDEFYFVRPGSGSVFRLLWSDEKTIGRLLYGPGQGSQVLVGYDKEMFGGTISVWAQHEFARQRLYDESVPFAQLTRRWLWDRDAYTLGYAGVVRDVEVDLDLAASWQRFAWESELPARRKDTVHQGILRLRGPGAKAWPLATLQLDRHRLRYWEPGRISADDSRIGLGLAVGLGGESANGRYELSVGRSDPGTEEAGLVFGGEGDYAVGGWDFQGYLGRSRRARLLPRLANDFYLQVAQAVAVPVEDPDPEAEVLDAAEVWAGRGWERSRVRVGLRATRIQGAISATSVGLDRLTSAGLALGPLPASAVGAEISVVALHAQAARALGWGFSIDGDGAVRTSDPGRESQLWMTPLELRGRLDWRGRLFAEALDLDLFLRGQWNGERSSTTGQISPTARFDGGGTAQVASLSLWLLFVNLTNGESEAASVGRSAMILPIRSFRMGLTWRFLD